MERSGPRLGNRIELNFNILDKKMGEKVLGWVIGVIILSVLGFLVYRFVYAPDSIVQRKNEDFKREADKKIVQMVKTHEMSPSTRVLVSLEQRKFHMKGCTDIDGSTEKMKYSIALGKDYEPCDICIDEGEVEVNIPSYRDHYK